jgi:membrane protein CcdC involved in cytochrome C biogenesis
MPSHAQALAVSLLGAIAILVWRVRETTRPITPRRIVIPPLGMSTGFGMFAAPQTRIPWAWAFAAFALGALVLSYPLIKTSRLHREGDAIYLNRSKAFLWVIFGLFALRLALRSYVEQYVSLLQTGAIFFVLAFGMIVRWRVTMFRDYRRLMREPALAS